VPSGASITSGQGTNAIIMNFGTASGNVKVNAVNGCSVSSNKNLPVTINCRVGAENFLPLQDVLIYPNPTNNYFSININSPDENDYQLVLRDMLGRKIKSWNNLKSNETF